jgi:hypothetical protein
MLHIAASALLQGCKHVAHGLLQQKQEAQGDPHLCAFDSLARAFRRLKPIAL